MKSLKYFALAMLTALAACDPIEDRSELESANLTADQLEITATPIVVNGKNSNEIIVENHSPLPSEWTITMGDGSNQVATSAYAKMYVLRIGQNEVKFRGLNVAKGTYVEKTLSFNVDAISYLPDDIAARLCIGQEGAPSGFSTTFDPSLITWSVEGNVLRVCNPNPVLSDWTCGNRTLDTNVGEIKLPSSGSYPFSITVTLADGTQQTVDLGTVVVKDFDLPQVVLNLIGEHGKKTWNLAKEKAYWLGFYMEPGEYDFTSYLGYFTAAFGMTGEENGSMTLDVEGNISVAPTGREGTFTWDFPDDHGWELGWIHSTIPTVGGIGFDSNSQTPTYTPKDYFVVECTAERLVIGAPCIEGTPLADWTQCMFWAFEAEAESPTAGLPEVVRNLIGESGTKTWKFADAPFYWLGFYMEPGQYDFSGYLGYFTGAFGMTGEETGTMTLDIHDNISVSPTGREGTFIYDFPDDHGWEIGTLKTTTPILGGIGFDSESQQPTYTPTEYIIVECTKDRLVLAAPCIEGATLADWTQCMFWAFVPAE